VGSNPTLGTTSFTALCITFRNIILYLGIPDEGKDEVIRISGDIRLVATAWDYLLQGWLIKSNYEPG